MRPRMRCFGDGRTFEPLAKALSSLRRVFRVTTAIGIGVCMVTALCMALAFICFTATWIHLAAYDLIYWLLAPPGAYIGAFVIVSWFISFVILTGCYGKR